MARYRFRLFIAGQLGKSRNAVANIRALGNQILGGDYELGIIDVLEHPELAEIEKVSATPTLSCATCSRRTSGGAPSRS